MTRLPARVDTARLRLRLWTDTDAAALKRVVDGNLAHLSPWMAWARHGERPIEEWQEFIAGTRAAWDADTEANYGVFLGDEPIGGCGLHRRGPANRLDIGYWIAAEHEGRGLVSELAAALTDAAFADQAIERVEIQHAAANARSAAVAERLGFVRDPHSPASACDIAWYTTRERWSARQRRSSGT